MTLLETPARASYTGTHRHVSPRNPTPWVVLGVVGIAALISPWSSQRLDAEMLDSATTVFLSLTIQALPFLVFGVILSAAISVFVPASFFERVFPRNSAIGVPVAGATGAAMPGCECASVPVAASLIRRGVPHAAAFTFLLTAPAINPIVLASTAAAFDGSIRMVVARAAASAIAAVTIGWIWAVVGKRSWVRLPDNTAAEGTPKFPAFIETIRHDFLTSGGYLVLGGVAAAVLKVVVPPEWLGVIADHPVLAVLGMGLLAVLLSLCSEADAFVAASLTQFSPTAQLTFLVVGPMIDIKLFAMQAGTFSRSFAARFAPLTFVVALSTGAVVGWWLLT